MIQTPVNQVRLTNVAVVRYKTKNKKFEIAWYKNKVQNYRDNVETDLNEVLQIYEIFANVSKGEAAKKADIQKYLHKDKDEAIKIILDKGSVQVSELERESEFESLKLKIANIVSTMCVNKENNVPFPVPIILKAMDDVKFHVKENQDAKKQALQLIKVLPEVIPLERAKMKVKFNWTDEAKAEEIKTLMTDKYTTSDDKAEGVLSKLDSEHKVGDGDIELTYLILPRIIRDLNEICNKDKSVSVEIIEHYVYSRLVSDKEIEEAKKVYEDSIKKRKADEEEELKENVVIISTTPGGAKSTPKDKEDNINCTSCKDANFATKEEFKAHYKSEWHLENTKRKMKSLPPFNEFEFLQWREEEIDKEMFKGKMNSKGKKKNKGKGKKNWDDE